MGHPALSAEIWAPVFGMFFGGFENKPGTTWGTVKADVCERFIAGYKSPNFCDLIANSPFPDSGR